MFIEQAALTTLLYQVLLTKEINNADKIDCVYSSHSSYLGF